MRGHLDEEDLVPEGRVPATLAKRVLRALLVTLAVVSCGPTSPPPECGPGTHPGWYCSPLGMGHQGGGCHWDCDPDEPQRSTSLADSAREVP